MSVRAYLVTENGFRYNDEGYELLNNPSSELVCPHKIFRTYEEARAYLDQLGGPDWHWDNRNERYTGPSHVILEMEIADEEKLATYESLLSREVCQEPGFWYALDPHNEGTSLPVGLPNYAYPTRRLEDVATLFGARPYGCRHPYQTLDYTDPQLWKEVLARLPTELVAALRRALHKARKSSTDSESLLRTMNHLNGIYWQLRNEREDYAHLPDPFETTPTPEAKNSNESPEEWARLVARIPPIRRDALRDYLNRFCLDIDWEKTRPYRSDYPTPPASPRLIYPPEELAPTLSPWEQQLEAWRQIGGLPDVEETNDAYRQYWFMEEIPVRNRAYLVTENSFLYNDDGFYLLNNPQTQLVYPHRIFRSRHEAKRYIAAQPQPNWRYVRCDDDVTNPILVILEVEIKDEETLIHYETLLARGEGTQLGMWCSLSLDQVETPCHPPENRVSYTYPTRRLEEVATLFGVGIYGMRHPYQQADPTDPTYWQCALPRLSPAIRVKLAAVISLAASTTAPEKRLLFFLNSLGSTYCDERNRDYYRKIGREPPSHDQEPFEPWDEFTEQFPDAPRLRTWQDCDAFLFQAAKDCSGGFQSESPEDWAALYAQLTPIRQDALRESLNEVCLGANWDRLRAFVAHPSIPKADRDSLIPLDANEWEAISEENN